MNELPGFGAAIKKARLAAGLGLETVAEAVGITHGPLSRIERGDSTSAETLIRLAAYFHISLDSLIRSRETALPSADHLANGLAEIALLRWWRDLDDERRPWAEVALRGMGWSPGPSGGVEIDDVSSAHPFRDEVLPRRSVR